jgi:hypothetical protein
MKYFESRIIILRFILRSISRSISRSKINPDQSNPAHFDPSPVLNPFNPTRFNPDPGPKPGGPFNPTLRGPWLYEYSSRPARSGYSDRISRPDPNPTTGQPRVGSGRPRVLAMSRIDFEGRRVFEGLMR